MAAVNCLVRLLPPKDSGQSPTTFTVSDVPLSETVLQFKARIQEQQGHAVAHQLIIFSGQRTDNAATLSTIGVCDEKKVFSLRVKKEDAKNKRKAVDAAEGAEGSSSSKKQAGDLGSSKGAQAGSASSNLRHGALFKSGKYYLPAGVTLVAKGGGKSDSKGGKSQQAQFFKGPWGAGVKKLGACRSYFGLPNDLQLNVLLAMVKVAGNVSSAAASPVPPAAAAAAVASEESDEEEQDEAAAPAHYPAPSHNAPPPAEDAAGQDDPMHMDDLGGMGEGGGIGNDEEEEEDEEAAAAVAAAVDGDCGDDDCDDIVLAAPDVAPAAAAGSKDKKASKKAKAAKAAAAAAAAAASAAAAAVPAAKKTTSSMMMDSTSPSGPSGLILDHDEARDAARSDKHYVVKHGVRYDRPILNLADSLYAQASMGGAGGAGGSGGEVGGGGCVLSLPDTQALWSACSAGYGVSACRLRTMRHILGEFNTTEDGRKYLVQRLPGGGDGEGPSSRMGSPTLPGGGGGGRGRASNAAAMSSLGVGRGEVATSIVGSPPMKVVAGGVGGADSVAGVGKGGEGGGKAGGVSKHARVTVSRIEQVLASLDEGTGDENHNNEGASSLEGQHTHNDFPFSKEDGPSSPAATPSRSGGGFGDSVVSNTTGGASAALLSQSHLLHSKSKGGAQQHPQRHHHGHKRGHTADGGAEDAFSGGAGGGQESLLRPSLPLPTTSSGLAKGRCQPWNRSDFQCRLATFSATKWFGRPQRLGAAACAAAGWINTGPNKLVCCLCTASMTLQIPLAAPPPPSADKATPSPAGAAAVAAAPAAAPAAAAAATTALTADKSVSTQEYEAAVDAAVKRVCGNPDSHKGPCPWSDPENASPASFVSQGAAAGGLSSQTAVLQSYKSRIEALIQLLPPHAEALGVHDLLLAPSTSPAAASASAAAPAAAAPGPMTVLLPRLSSETLVNRGACPEAGSGYRACYDCSPAFQVMNTWQAKSTGVQLQQRLRRQLAAWDAKHPQRNSASAPPRPHHSLVVHGATDDSTHLVIEEVDTVNETVRITNRSEGGHSLRNHLKFGVQLRGLILTASTTSTGGGGGGGGGGDAMDADDGSVDGQQQQGPPVKQEHRFTFGPYVLPQGASVTVYSGPLCHDRWAKDTKQHEQEQKARLEKEGSCGALDGDEDDDPSADDISFRWTVSPVWDPSLHSVATLMTSEGEVLSSAVVPAVEDGAEVSARKREEEDMPRVWDEAHSVHILALHGWTVVDGEDDAAAGGGGAGGGGGPNPCLYCSCCQAKAPVRFYETVDKVEGDKSTAAAAAAAARRAGGGSGAAAGGGGDDGESLLVCGFHPLHEHKVDCAWANGHESFQTVMNALYPKGANDAQYSSDDGMMLSQNLPSENFSGRLKDALASLA